MSLPQKFHNGQLYHYASDEIRCNADKEGAQVFEIEVGGFWGIACITFRILSTDSLFAEEKANQEHPDYCEHCKEMPCMCPDPIEDED